MIRKTLTIFSLVGLLLSVGLWGASLFGVFYFDQHGTFACSQGRLYLRFSSEFSTAQSVSVGLRDGPYVDINSGQVVLLKFRGWSDPWWPILSWTPLTISLSLWLATFLFAGVFFSLWHRPLYRHRRRKRKKLGLCLKCGYDLRGSKEKCSECGTEFESSGV